MSNKNPKDEDTEIKEQETKEAQEEKQKKPRKVSKETEKRNAITFEFMKDYISKKAPNDKDWFKEVAFDENNNYMHFKARKEFINRYMPELAGKKKLSKWEQLQDW